MALDYMNTQALKSFKTNLKKRGKEVVFSQIDHDDARRFQALLEGAEYASQHMKEAFVSNSKNAVFHRSLEHMPEMGLILEFGVWSGRSINIIADTVGSARTVHGFDSFEGLPESWYGPYTKGMFHTGGKLPEVRSNVVLHVGWFDQTLPEFVCKQTEQVAFLHVDCDLYSSTKTIFDNFGDRIGPGTVILFDEYFNYPGWREHEHKAFQEFVGAKSLRYRYLAYNASDMNAAVQII